MKKVEKKCVKCDRSVHSTFNNILSGIYNMTKKGFIPVWKPVHTTAVEQFEQQIGEQAKLSPKFSDFGNVMKWLDEDS